MVVASDSIVSRMVAQWFVRVTVHRRRREMGLGPLQEIPLKLAREKAAEARQLVRQGVDPIKKRRVDRRAAERDPRVLQKLGRVTVAEVTQIDIRDCLAPIWHAKADTARKAISRLAIVLRHATALGLDVDLKAVDEVKALLGKQNHTARHIEAMPWREIPDFYETLVENATGLALRLLILTGVRWAPVGWATLDQFDLTTGAWTIPADVIKGRKGVTADFRVPRSEEAAAVVERAARLGGPVRLPGRRGQSISDMTMSKLMRDRGLAARPHGFRASFRTCREETGKRFEVAETALGHQIGNRVERAYQRSDLLEERRTLMRAWADQVTNQEINVVRIGA